MKIIADLHIHSKYSRATSPKMEVVVLSEWAKIKGINLLATGDIFHPEYVKELKEKLIEDGSGVLKLRGTSNEAQGVKFVLSGEISCIYKHGEKTRRVHHLLFFPDFKSVDDFNKKLEERGCNIRSDGRPIVGLSSKEILKLLLEVNKEAFLIPAHAWTPWFAIFGSKSGYDSIEECFEELSSEIFAIETGLSSDPEMNWRLSALDKITLISNSDAHSPLNLGREANVFDMDEVTFAELKRILKEKDKKKFLYTIEFYPQEGKYHFDGHKDCKFFCSPEESLKLKNICPVCQKSLVLGVDHRVVALADRELGFEPKNKIPFKSIVPLCEIIAEIMQVGKQSKKVMKIYEQMLKNGGNEFNILLELSREEIVKIGNEMIAEAVIRVRSRQVKAVPGYDGEFGKITVFDQDELKKMKPRQVSLL
ncbi:DNA helicase UvrD [Candidatus Falkowbacteria bacterium RIFOXYB2_FULL_35_7]|uniref:DNA helicase UvrD n=1 Tax=Candidatus Falkowbacteria bacterium RIFOXYC2_FULL_36_12 TaxID=1798002 RepID=A0A1F5T3M5_9BACT|nr:MAG: DNA helicase UvrD [Candidatus Falkowbacteria bacterium RIFOXYB2_FULL_35_7]OGF33522.1 MAG: DNA helicase UvrD [Candidatus Falkowbacteria bacterium RIFOXYC2_FULL_36_12]